MTKSNDNPVLTFVLNVGETIQILWDKFYKKLTLISWGNFFLISLFSLIIGGILNLASLVSFSVICCFILKCFFGKEDQINNTKNTTDSNITNQSNET